MKLEAPEIVESNGSVEYRVGVSSSAGTAVLWYSLPSQWGHLISAGSDAGLLALLVPAMAQGEDIRVAGTVSERLYYNISGPLQRVLQLVMPTLRKVRIDAESVEVGEPKSGGVATGFTGGVDSFYTLSLHHYETTPESLRLTHLVYNNVGSHGSAGESLFRQRFERLRPAAERLGLPFIPINSNISKLYRPHENINYQQNHTVRNASVGLLLQGGLRRFLLSSSLKFEDVFVGPAFDFSFCDPVAVPLMSTDALDLLLVGSDITRVGKTLAVSELEDTYDSLEVCEGTHHGAGNCSRCIKCLRTLFTLELAGRMDQYRGLFDFEIYRKHRSRFIAKALRREIPLMREVVDFMRDSGVRPPISARAYALVRGPDVERELRSAGRRIVKRFRSFHGS